jgi:hypothetical protein
MMTNDNNSFVDATRALLGTYPRDLWFPFGDDLPLPTELETKLVVAMERASPLQAEAVRLLREHLSVRDAYALATFAVRMALLAARTARPQLVELALIGLLIDDGVLDYRDLLRALALTEYCAACVGTDFETLIGKMLPLASAGRSAFIRDTYLSRPPDARSLEAVGYAAAGTGLDLHFTSRFWS